MRDRLIVLTTAAALAAATSLVGAVHSAFTAKASPAPGRFAAAATFAPRNLTAPTISGANVQGATLTGDAGTWARRPESLVVEWLRCAAGDCTYVSRGATRELTAEDVGHRMKLRVTATNAGGSATAPSAVTELVQGPPVNTAPPSAAGTATVGETLTASAGTWQRAYDEPRFRWLRCTAACAPIANETGRTLLLTGLDAGATIRVEVTHGGVTAGSAATATVDRASFTHVICADPVTGAGVGEDAVLPDGVTHGDTLAVISNPRSRTRCSGAAGGIPLSTAGSFTTSAVDDRTWLLYRAPAPLRFGRAEIYRHGTMSGRWSWAVQTSESTAIFAQPRAELCSWGSGCTSRGTAATPFAAENRVTVPRGAVNGFNVTLACDIPAGWSCSADGTQTVRVFGGTATLSDTETPSAPAPPRGTLATADPLPPVPQLGFDAADEGAGVHRLIVLLDDAVVARQHLPEASGRCADVRPGDGDPFQFAHQQPCPLTMTGSVQFDTAGWPRGRRRLRVLLEDAGRNTLPIVDRTVTVP